VDTPWRTGGCAGIAANLEQARLMRENYAAASEAKGAGIDCILIVPPHSTVLFHELGLCATLGRDYWNKNVKDAGEPPHDE
jgi:hypothetical protein